MAWTLRSAMRCHCEADTPSMGIMLGTAVASCSRPSMWGASAISLASSGGPRALAVAGMFFSVGVLGFSGSIYLMVLLQMAWLGPVTPLGGLSLIAGWGCLCLAIVRVNGSTPGQDLQRRHGR